MLTLLNAFHNVFIPSVPPFLNPTKSTSDNQMVTLGYSTSIMETWSSKIWSLIQNSAEMPFCPFRSWKDTCLSNPVTTWSEGSSSVEISFTRTRSMQVDSMKTCYSTPKSVLILSIYWRLHKAVNQFFGMFLLALHLT